jgi:hypothetical protein
MDVNRYFVSIMRRNTYSAGITARRDIVSRGDLIFFHAQRLTAYSKDLLETFGTPRDEIRYSEAY